MLVLTNVSKRFDATVALEPTSLSIATGRTTALIGPSGCGKTTLLRLMLGLTWPDEGEVRFDGQPLTPGNLIAVRRRLGYVIQEGGLFPHLTAQQNVTLLADYLKWPTGRIDGRIEELARLVHIDPGLLSRYPTQLSGGQRQRVALMRALMPDPEVLLLDEPLAALDPMIRYDLQEELRVIFDTLGKTVVLVTHDIAEAVFFAHEIVLMRRGVIVQSGSPRDLIERPANAFVERFLRAQRQLRLAGDGQ
ncbi:MAG: ATP-binding cassette domain-containing protein [Chromatiaceae bacterium]|jgi:osmoprotectant transport system ATP-binding protein